MSLRLPSDIYSPDHLNIVMLEVDGLAASMRDATVRARHSDIANDIHISEALMGVLHESGVATNDQRAVEKLLIELKTVRDSGPVVHLIVSALPKRGAKRQLVNWCRQTIHPYALMTFAVRTDMGGGFMARVGSRQYDFTYKTRLFENRHRISEIFDGVRK